MSVARQIGMAFGSSWQGAVIAVVQWVFVLSLLPMVFHPTEKPTFSAAVLTAISLFAMAFTLATLPDLRIAAWSMAASGVVWTVLGWQRHRTNKRAVTRIGEPHRAV
jgi:glycerol-3-phosphate acyltransferase PlsY